MTAINRILITGRLYKEMKEALEGKIEKELLCLPEEEVTEEVLRWADAYVAFRPTVNFDFYNIKWVHALGAGVDSFLFEKEWKRDVLLTRTICSFGKKISEYCISYILSQLQLHKEFENAQKSGKWQVLPPISLNTQNILIFGTGVIGQELAKNLSFFGAKVTGVSLSGTKKEHFEGVEKLSGIQGLLPNSNWIINTLPLTDKTEEIFNEDIFYNMNAAGFINVGRGRSVKEEALIKALDSNNLKVAVLDVFSTEPLPEASMLWKHPKIIITPHISAITSVEEAVDCFLDTLSRLESGQLDLENTVSIEKGY